MKIINNKLIINNNLLIIMSTKYVFIELEDFPIDGWINGCIMCSEPTSRTEKIFKYEVHICNKCKKLKPMVKTKMLYKLITT